MTYNQTPVQPSAIASRFSPWLINLAYPLICWGALPLYFREIEVLGQENIPTTGPVILAPTHRSRWDPLLIGSTAGRWVSGHDLRFMVSANEVSGIQGWFIRRLGGFPVDPKRPAIASLRHGVELLQSKEMLVIFPEGGIFRDGHVHPLKPGLARLALQAELMQPCLGVKILPITLHYGHPQVTWGCGVEIRIGKPLHVSDYTSGNVKESARQLTSVLESSLKGLNENYFVDNRPYPSLGRSPYALTRHG